MTLADWLVEREQLYGGPYRAPLTCFSPYDARTEWQKHRKRIEGSIGGDRMGKHGYAQDYASALTRRFGQGIPINGKHVIVELGILRGTGLALWCDLFPEARVIGLDIDTEPYRNSQDGLRQLGAFSSNLPEVYQLDELAPHASDRLGQILGADRIDVFIDDAAHYDGAVLHAFRSVRRHLNEHALYFIEDNATAAKRLGESHQQHGLLTVIGA